MEVRSMQEAFAHVLFHALWDKFKVPSEKNYRLEDVGFEINEGIVSAIVSLQLCFRHKLEPLFKDNPGMTIDGAKFFPFVDNCLDSFASYEAPFHRMLGSCGIFAEFTLYKYTLDNEQSLLLAPQFWPKYFNDRLKSYFDENGGMEELIVKAGSVNEIMQGLDKYLTYLKQPYDFSELAGYNERVQEYRKAVLESLKQYSDLVKSVEETVEETGEEARVPPLSELPSTCDPPLPESSPSSKSGGTGGARSKIRRRRDAVVEGKPSEELEKSPRKTSPRTAKSSPTDKKALPVDVPKPATSVKAVLRSLADPKTEEYAEPSTTTARITRSSARRQAEGSQVAKSELSLQTKGVLPATEQTQMTRLAEKFESSYLQLSAVEAEDPCDEPEGGKSSEVTESAEKEPTRKTGKGKKGSRKSKKK